jgi:hypothetical protein
MHLLLALALLFTASVKAEMYSYRDSKGAVTVVFSLEKVPKRYRKNAKRVQEKNKPSSEPGTETISVNDLNAAFDSWDKPSGAPCSPVELVYDIPAAEMARGASDNAGSGSCRGMVYFSGSRGRTKGGDCGSFHCGTLKYGDGREKANYCSVLATCKDGKAVATGFTW